MRTFERISNDHLIIEVIRRLRVRNVLGGGRTAPEGTGFDKLLQFMTDSGVSPKNLSGELAALLQTGDIILTGQTSFRKAGQRQFTRGSFKKGMVGRLHPDATLAAMQYFTENGTPITSRRDKETGRLIYPGENISYWGLLFDRIYVVSDELPKSIDRKLAVVDPY